MILSLSLLLLNLVPSSNLFLTGPVLGQEEYNLHISTMEIVDRDGDGRKDGLEIFYILKKGEKKIELGPEAISQLEVYLYEDREQEALMSFWQIGELKDLVFFESNIYLPFRKGFAYNIYMDKIVPAILKLKLVFKEGGKVEANLKDRLSFLSY